MILWLAYLFAMVVFFAMSTHRDHPRLVFAYWIFNSIWIFAWGFGLARANPNISIWYLNWLDLIWGVAGACLSWLILGRPRGWTPKKN